MDKYIYQAKFTLANAVSDKGFKTAQQALVMFTDFAEMIDEGIFDCHILVDVKAKLSSNHTGLLTLSSPRKLNDQELTQISKLIDFEINNDGFNDGFDFVDTKVGEGTAVIWHAQDNQFKLVNAFSHGKAIKVA